MPRVNSDPEGVRPYKFHGIDLENQGAEWVGPCPFCDKMKFSVNVKTGLARCLVCAEGSEKGGFNPRLFIRKLHDLSFKQTESRDYAELRDHIGLTYSETLVNWQLCRSVITGNWLVPGYDEKRILDTCYVLGEVLYPTPTLGHSLHGLGQWTDPTLSKVFLCEGWKDGLTLYEYFANFKPDGSRTSNSSRSMLSLANVCAVAGCGSVGSPLQRYQSLFKDKEVYLAFDNDYPKKNGAVPGFDALKRACAILSSAASLQYLHWGEGGWSESYPTGTDVRDILHG